MPVASLYVCVNTWEYNSFICICKYMFTQLFTYTYKHTETDANGLNFNEVLRLRKADNINSADMHRLTQLFKLGLALFSLSFLSMLLLRFLSW